MSKNLLSALVPVFFTGFFLFPVIAPAESSNEPQSDRQIGSIIYEPYYCVAVDPIYEEHKEGNRGQLGHAGYGETEPKARTVAQWICEHYKGKHYKFNVVECGARW
jgi:hypothetical protein